MGLLRKRQVLRAIESSEGIAIAVNSSHYTTAHEISTTTPQDIEDRITSGASLSSDLGVVGRTPFQSSYYLDYYGLDGVTPPVMDPELRAGGHKVTSIPYNTISGAGTGPAWAGQTVSDGLGGTAQLAVTVGSGTRLYYRDAAGGFPGDTSVSTPTSGVITLASTTPAGAAWQYSPDSTATATVTLTGAGWGGTTVVPVAGEIVTNGLDGAAAARGIVVDVVSTVLQIIPIFPLSPFLAGQTVTGLTGGGTNTVAGAGQALYRVPSLTISDNIDGWRRLGSGNRGALEAILEAGKIGRLQCNFQGQLYSHGDVALVTGVSDVSPSSLPRWANAVASIEGFEIPMTRWSLVCGADVQLLPDAHGANGIRGSAITARTPSLSIDPDGLPAGVLNTLSRLTTATTLNCFTMWGSTVGLRVCIHVPRGQIYSKEDADKNGLRGDDLNVRPKRQTADGEDEYYLLFGV